MLLRVLGVAGIIAAPFALVGMMIVAVEWWLGSDAWAECFYASEGRIGPDYTSPTGASWSWWPTGLRCEYGDAVIETGPWLSVVFVITLVALVVSIGGFTAMISKAVRRQKLNASASARRS